MRFPDEHDDETEPLVRAWLDFDTAAWPDEVGSVARGSVEHHRRAQEDRGSTISDDNINRVSGKSSNGRSTPPPRLELNLESSHGFRHDFSAWV